MLVMLIPLMLSFTDLVPFGKDQTEKREQIDKLKANKDHLHALESSMKKTEIEESKPKEEIKPVAESPSIGSASNWKIHER